MVTGTTGAWQEYLGPTFAEDLPLQHSPNPEYLWSLYLGTSASPGNTCALTYGTNVLIYHSPSPKLSAEESLPYLGTPAPNWHTWARLPPPTIAHRQHLHILKLQGGVGWVQRSTVVGHVHVDKGFGEAHPPLFTPRPPALPRMPTPKALGRASAPALRPPTASSQVPSLPSCVSNRPLGGSAGSLGLAPEKGWRLCQGGLGVNG